MTKGSGGKPAMTPYRPGLSEQWAQTLAARIDRRQFMRRASKATFATVAIGLAGGGVSTLLFQGRAYANTCSDPSSVNGAGCPSGGVYGYAPCGPSPCCGAAGRSAGCNCSAGRGECLSGTKNCPGPEYNIYDNPNLSPSNCWACPGPLYESGGLCYYQTTVCCDCGTTDCSDPYGRCISWYSYPTQVKCS
jgi:hypothetical protein